jgi:hypothetical protein
LTNWVTRWRFCVSPLNVFNWHECSNPSYRLCLAEKGVSGSCSCSDIICN